MLTKKDSYKEGMATTHDAKYSAASTELGDFGPAYVSALVCWLCHESCEEEGGIFEAGMGYYRKARLQTSRGVFLTSEELGAGVAPTPDDIAVRATDLVSFDRDAEAGMQKPGNMGNF